jgi:hypothetical protein
MPTDLKLLMIEDLEMLLCLQCEKAAWEAEAKRLRRLPGRQRRRPRPRHARPQ